MGFKSVYQVLKELFPQVDSRLLKAVAIEHSKDPDAAVEYILTDVLPYTGDKSNAPTPVVGSDGKAADTCNANPSMSGSGNGAVTSSLLNDGQNLDDDSTLSFYDANDSDDPVSGNPKSALTSGKSDERSAVTADLGEYSKDNYSQALGNLEGVSIVPLQERKTDLYVNMTGDALSSSVSVKVGEADVRLDNVENEQRDRSDGSSSCDLEQAPVFDLPKEQPSAYCNSLEAESDSTFSYANEKEMNNSLDTEFTLEFPETDDVAAEGETLLSTIVTRSGQICKVNLLEDIIEEAKNYKASVCSAMESVVRLMKEVELQENEAEQAKVASARGGLDILEKVEEIKKMLIHAKEANDMHAGEVYGEKSILATEVKELQARLLGLSDEKDKSLLMLDEMREKLEERLAVAEEQKRAADKEMFDKEEIAQGALTEQELIMDKVVQDSKLLQQEAEENAKLRDFLMEKGQVVDVLQGEISVICQDVKALKENFDNHVSLNKSLSIEQTSCRLASSSSSVKSSASLKSTTSLKSIASLNRTASLKSTTSSKSSVSLNSSTSDVSAPESPKRMIETPRSELGEMIVSHNEARAQKLLLDEDWELCDMA